MSKTGFVHLAGLLGLFLAGSAAADHNWCHETNPSIQPERAFGKLSSGQEMKPGAVVCSASGEYILSCEADGNVVIYRGAVGGNVVWASNTEGTLKACVMQHDGNFVAQDIHGLPLFQTRTAGNPGAYLTLDDSGKIAIVKDLWFIQKRN